MQFSPSHTRHWVSCELGGGGGGGGDGTQERWEWRATWTAWPRAGGGGDKASCRQSSASHSKTTEREGGASNLHTGVL